VLLQPSIFEGFGLPLVEAMACGCPVVASDLATIREVVAGGGALVAPGDVTAFGRAAAALVASPSRRQDAGEQGRARAAAFSWDRCARDTLAVYREAAAGQFG
jgi:glycosyltransferase involved in cell wall biosynthesis